VKTMWFKLQRGFAGLIEFWYNIHIYIYIYDFLFILN
jgi:hypothetical protein